MNHAPVGELTYDQCRDELVEVVRQLEQGGINLDAALTLWERGEALARRCQEHLDGARTRIEAALAWADEDDPDTD
jgi:exodeoxyribonuclease VII small subunit